MRKITFLIFSIILFGCYNSNKYSPLIGKWYSGGFDTDFVEIEFSKDSMVEKNYFGVYTANWKTRDNTLYLINRNGPFLDKKDISRPFKFNANKSTLTIIFQDTTDSRLPLIKANNPYDYFQKSIGLQIELPIIEAELESIGFPNSLNFNIYAGFSNHSLLVKTDSSHNLNKLEIEVNEFKENSREELIPFLRFNLIADKSISKSQIDSIKLLLTKTSIQRVFRTYKNSERDYENSLNWFGRKE